MKPLSDVRVIAIEQYGAGPFGSLHLADLGAEVIKVEDPTQGGDFGRHVPPFESHGDSLFFETFNRNKKSISLDLSRPLDRRVFEELIAESDALYANVRGDVPEKLGLRYADLKHINPGLVCVFISGFGLTGPLSNEPGYDYVLQAIAGWMSLTGEPDGPPTKTGLSLVDFVGGYVGALALLTGVHAARRDGAGMDCDVGLFDTAMNLLTYPATWYLNEGWTPVRTTRSAHPSLVPFQLFKGSDGEWFVAGCAKDKFFVRLSEVVGLPDLPADERFSDFRSRLENKDELIGILDDAFSTRSAADWVGELKRVGVPTGLVQTVAAALSDPQTEARHLIVETEHERFGTVRTLASPVRIGDHQPTYQRAPRMNEDVEEILSSVLGYDDDRVAQLRSELEFGETQPMR